MLGIKVPEVVVFTETSMLLFFYTNILLCFNLFQINLPLNDA